MNDDTPTNLAAEAEAPELAQEVDETPEVETEETESEPDADDAGQTEEDEYEVDLDGEKFKIPGKLKDKFRDSLLRQADYTKKTQELAESKRAFEASQGTFAEQQKALHQHVLEVSKLVSIDEQLASYDKVDWSAWNEQDPVAAQRGWFAKEQLKDARNGLGQKLAQEHNDQVTREQQDTAKRIEESQAVIKAQIPGWDQTYADKLTEHAIKVVPNATKEQLRQVQLVNPGFVVFLDKAAKFDQLMAKQRASAGTPVATPVTPVTTVGNRRAPANNAPDPKDADAWRTWRNAQIAKRQAAGR